MSQSDQVHGTQPAHVKLVICKDCASVSDSPYYEPTRICPHCRGAVTKYTPPKVALARYDQNQPVFGQVD